MQRFPFCDDDKEVIGPALPWEKSLRSFESRDFPSEELSRRAFDLHLLLTQQYPRIHLAMAPSTSRQPLWLRAEKKEFERRSALTPTTARKLIDAGFDISVERDEQRIFDDEEFEK